jgi:predicted porin
MGSLILGTPNNETLTNNTAIASPEFSTGVGSAYSTVFSTANGIGTGTTGYGGTAIAQATIDGTANVGARAIRINNTVKYQTPVFNGLQFTYAITPQNNNLTAASGNGNTVGVTEYALRYTNGPVDAMYSSIKYDVGSNGTAQLKITTTAGGAIGVTGYNTMALQDNTQNMLGVKYQVLPSLKLNVGIGSFTSSSGTYQGSSRGYGGTYTMGAVDILAQIVSVNDTSTTDYDRKLTGLGVNYNLSKTAKAYFRYDSINYATNQTAVSGSTQKRTGFGISKSF